SKGIHRVQQANGHTARGAKAGALGRDVCHGGDLDALGDARLPQALPHELVLDLVHMPDHLRPGIADADLSVESLLYYTVNILVDGGADDTALLALKESGEVGTAAGKADAQRCLRNDQRDASTPADGDLPRRSPFATSAPSGSARSSNCAS